MEIYESTVNILHNQPTVVTVKFGLTYHDWCELQESALWHRLEECISQKEHNNYLQIVRELQLEI